MTAVCFLLLGGLMGPVAFAADEAPVDEAPAPADEGPATESDAPEPEGEPPAPVNEAPEPHEPDPDEAPEPPPAEPIGELEQASAEPTPPEPEAAPRRKKPEVRYTLNEDFEMRYWRRPERVPGFEDRHVLDYVEQVNRLNGMVGVGPLSLGVQIDQVALFGNRYYLDDVLKVERELFAEDVPNVLPGESYANPEKLWLRYESPLATVVLGDFYAAFGRGIALNVNRNTNIDIDTSIQGVKAVIRPGAWDLTVLAGQLNRQQVYQDNPNLAISRDRRHAVAGVRLERYGLGPANLGAHAVVYDYVDEPGWKGGFDQLGTTPDVVIGGATAELVGLGGIDWYVETDLFGFPTDVAFGGEDPALGHAVYGSATAYLGPTVLQIEGKRYHQAERPNTPLATELYEIVVGPTLEYERWITEDSSLAVNSQDVTGGRARLDWTIESGLTPYVSMAVFRDTAGALIPETIYHPLIGIELLKGDWALIANAGFRYDDRDGGSENGSDRHAQGDLIAKIPLGGRFALDVAIGAERFMWGPSPLPKQDYTEVESSLSVSWGSLVTLTWFSDFSNDPLVPSTGNLTESLYGAGEIQVKPLPALTIKAFYGAYKAGIRCSGGQCRQLPGFDGGRISLVAAF